MEWKDSLRNTCKICHLQALHSGIVWINCSQPTLVQAPWGGNKRSGFGRELGEWWVPHYYASILKDRTISLSPLLNKRFSQSVPSELCSLFLSGALRTTWPWSKSPSTARMSHGDGTSLHRSCKRIHARKNERITLKTQHQSCAWTETCEQYSALPIKALKAKRLVLLLTNSGQSVPYHGLSSLHSLSFAISHWCAVALDKIGVKR